MDLSDFHFFKNENLKIALYYRKVGKYKLGFTFLKKACHEDNDPQAHFLMGEVYAMGGFGVLDNERLSRRWYESSSKLGCTWAKATLQNFIHNGDEDNQFAARKDLDSFTKALVLKYTNLDLCFTYLQEAIKEGNVLAYRLLSTFFGNQGMLNVLIDGWQLGDPACHFHYVRDMLDMNDFEELICMSAKQKYSLSMSELTYMYTRQKLFSKAFYWYVKRRMPYEATDAFLKWQNSFSSVSFDYHIGNWQFGYIMRKYPGFLQQCIGYGIESRGGKIMLAFYDSCSNKIRQSVFCFIWATQGMLCKDLRIVIGKMLWRTRKDYQSWEKLIKANGG